MDKSRVKFRQELKLLSDAMQIAIVMLEKGISEDQVSEYLQKKKEEIQCSEFK